MTRRIIQYTEDADHDIEVLFLLSAEGWGIEHMLRRRTKLFAAIDFIAENPGMGQFRSHPSGEYRRFFLDPHYIYYRVTPTKVVIGRIVHQRQEPIVFNEF